jgi:Asp-tRNA(Asn)/Glu-tRNA(Gln) amidotransferase A subunit family amidase
MSLPVGLGEAGMPVGFQIMAPLLRDDLMLRAARALEAEVGFDATPRGPNALAGAAI